MDSRYGITTFTFQMSPISEYDGLIHRVSFTPLQAQAVLVIRDGGPATNATINGPGGLTVDSCGNIYLADVLNRRIRRISNPVCTRADLFNYSAGIQSIIIFPNPATAQLTITANNKINEVVITNLIGTVVYNHAYNISNIQVDIAQLPPGMYLLQLTDENGQKVVKKVVKE
jgi:hypothetical protein